ncbi:unnamed protein product [Adineta steineri]|uniref:EGF-like domain-containing protein n=1 Tax=Adineta steineri TaxID=433720 RepID=A0A818ZQX9_9BILA|nr:unnamed protein product [Adineta steineri]CAF3775886.1 unnamed protein product [Adineta steineri]
MAGLTSTSVLSLFLICCMIISANAANNTTQFDNFTIEWDDFSLFTCALPSTLQTSIFTCGAGAQNYSMNDIDCLQQTTVDFDQGQCQITTTQFMYTTSAATTTAQMTTVASTTANVQTSTSTVPATTQSASTTTPTQNQTTNYTGTSYTSMTVTNATATTARSSNTSATIQTTTATAASSNTSATIQTTTATATISNTSAAIQTTVNLSTATAATASSSSMASVINSTMMAATAGPGSNTTITTALSTTTPQNTYACDDSSYIGAYCNISSDACAMSQPCQNAATCFPNNTLPLEYFCKCAPDYTGYNCEIDENACQAGTCWNDGTCLEGSGTSSSTNGSTFTCECSEGYDGVYCELKVNLCGNITCENKGECETYDMHWKCVCLDSTLYYGDYCQFKTSKLEVKEILSKSFASIAIASLIVTCGFILIMDILKYFFHIDPVEYERETYRKRRDQRRRARKPPKNGDMKLALRFQYIA